MQKIFVDTDILIDYSKGYDKYLDKLLNKQKMGSVQLFINPVVVTEFFTDKNLKNPDKFSLALEFISLFNQLDITKNIGLLAGKLLRDQETSFLGDALIAATCLHQNLSLATGNIRHFNKISKLQLFFVN